MKAFNKLFSLVVASVLVFSLAGCGDKEESKKFSANLNGTEIAITQRGHCATIRIISTMAPIFICRINWNAP